MVERTTPAATGDAREQRIAGLRERRRARMRMLARRGALGTLGLVALVVALLMWLLTTVGGRDLLLRQVVARLPAGTTLTWQSAQGPASGPLTLRGVRFSTPRQFDSTCIAAGNVHCARGTIVFTADSLVVDPALRPLLGRRLRLDALDVHGATLQLPRDDTPLQLPRWPQSLPDIAPPLALQADRIRIDGLKVSRAGAPLIDVRHADGGLDAGTGRLHVEHLRIDSDRGRFTVHGDYAPRDAYRSDLVATAVLPAPAGRSAPRLGLVMRGDLVKMTVALSGNVPAPLHLLLALHDPAGSGVPRWTLRAQADALDPGLLLGSGTPSTPLRLALSVDGNGGDARLHGNLVRGDFNAVLQPSQLRLHDQVLVVQPLVVDLLGGRITARGQADLRTALQSHDASGIRLAINARGLQWSGVDASSSVRGDADLGVAGAPDAWAAIGRATLVRGKQRAQLRLDGRGDRRQVAIRALHASMPGGTLDATGSAHWSPTLGWDLDARLSAFDPGYFMPDWPGAVDGHVATTGDTRSDGGLDAHFVLSQLGGRLRGRPLAGRGQLAVHTFAKGTTSRYDGSVDLTLGASHVDARGRIDDRLDIMAKFSPLQLHDLLPKGAGTLRGTLELTGPRNAPDVAADLDGSGLRYAGYRADTLHAHGRLPWHGGNGALDVDARGLVVGVAVDALQLHARGAVDHLQLDAGARGDLGSVTLAASTDRQGGRWQGTLSRLQLQPARGTAWRLQAPVRFAQANRGWTLSHGCFGASGGGELCASANWPRHGIDIDGHGLPLTLATPYLPPRSDGKPWLLHGDVALQAHVQPVGAAWRGMATLTSATGGLRNSGRARHDLVGYRQLQLATRFDPKGFDARLGTALDGGGRVDAHVVDGWDAYAPLSGDIAMDTDALTWMELLSPDIVAPTGHLAGRIALHGTRDQPSLGGQARLTNFATELPALAIAVSDGNVQLDALPDGSARIHGSLRSGDGTAHIDGTLGWRGDLASGNSVPLVLNVRGKDLLASDTRDLHAVIDPDVVVRYRAGQPLDVSGTVGVPQARIDLERLDQGVKSSPDVVVLDPVDPQQQLATPLQLDLTLALGDDVQLHGFGLDGTLGGSLRVRATPGREMLATGTLEVGGRYTAYGQKLDIERGHLTWSGSPIADPLLDIRAQREVGAVTAGIDVSGRASRPQAEVWTDPASDQSEALAYLALGRPLSSANGDEARQLDAASAALSAGGSLLASQLGARLGLDEAGVVESRALGGSVLGVGKYLSPRLYVGYGVSLLGTGQVLTLKYLLRKGFDIQIESSTIENRASANWRKER